MPVIKETRGAPLSARLGVWLREGVGMKLPTDTMATYPRLCTGTRFRHRDWEAKFLTLPTNKYTPHEQQFKCSDQSIEASGTVPRRLTVSTPTPTQTGMHVPLQQQESRARLLRLEQNDVRHGKKPSPLLLESPTFRSLVVRL